MGAQFFISAAIIGLWSGLYTGFLTHPGEALSFIPAAYEKATHSEHGSLTGWKYSLAKPLYLCAICHAGQVSFWSYLLFFDWSLWHHFAFVVVSMCAANEAAKRFDTWN